MLGYVFEGHQPAADAEGDGSWCASCTPVRAHFRSLFPFSSEEFSNDVWLGSTSLRGRLTTPTMPTTMALLAPTTASPSGHHAQSTPLSAA
jgi:hypothetical protein